MPGRLFLTRDDIDLAALHPDPPGDSPRRNIAPGQMLRCLTPAGWGLARWGMIPQGRVNARGRPVMETVVNARSETVFDKSAFQGVGRAVVPADGWYEWTGKAGRKQAHAIRRADGGLVLFAALHLVWQAPGGRAVAQVATITCAPSTDVVAIHDRMGALLTPDKVQDWLTLPDDQARAMLRPALAGTLVVGPADGVDWTGP
jgi:putative SOS response-associated peptidase YedK